MLDGAVTIDTEGHTTAITGDVSGAGGFTKINPGTLVLAGLNTFTGGVTLDAGTLVIENGDSLGDLTSLLTTATGTTVRFGSTPRTLALANPINVTGATNFDLGGGGIVSFDGYAGTVTTDSSVVELDGAIGGDGPIILSPYSDLALNGANSFGGTFTVTESVIRVGSGAAFGDSAVVLNEGIVLNDSGVAVTLANPIAISGSGVFGGSSDLTVGPIEGSGLLVKIGPDTLTLTGDSNFDNTAIVDAGTLDLQGNLVGGGGAVLALGTTLSGQGTIFGTTISSGATIAPNSTLIFSDLQLDAATNLNFDLGAPAAAHDLILVNSHLILDGTLNIADLGGLATGIYTLFSYGPGGLTDNGLLIGSIPGGFNAGDFNIFTGGGLIQLGVLLPSGPFLNWDGGNMAANGAIDGGSGTWNATDTNWTSPTGTSNDIYPGAIGNFGTVGGTVTVVGTQTFDQLNFTVDGYTLNGDLLAGSALATIDVAGGATTVINNGISGASGLVKSGSGTLVLGGNNVFNGLSLDSGEVNVTSSNAAGSGPLSLGAGTTFSAGVDTLVIFNDIALVGNATIGTNNFLFATAGPITGGGSLTKTGSGVLFLAGSNSYTGGTNVNDGTFVVYNSNSAGTGTIAIASGAQLANAPGPFATPNDITLTGQAGLLANVPGDLWTLSGVISDGGTAGTLIKKGSGAIILAGSNTYTGGTDLEAGILQIASDDALGAGDLTFSGAATLFALGDLSSSRQVNLNADGTIDTNGFSVTLGAITEGLATGSLTKVGAGTLVLGSGNTYGGGTALQEGTLQVYDGSSIGTGTLTTADGTTLIAGEAGGPSAFTLTNDIVLNGALTVDLRGTQAGTPSYDLTTGLFATDGTTLTLSGPISGGGGLLTDANTPGNLYLTGNNSYSGGTVLNVAGVSVGSATALGTGLVTLDGGLLVNNSGGALTIANNIVLAFTNGFFDALGGADDLTLTGTINGSNDLTSKFGAGTLTLTNTGNSFDGMFDIFAGTVRIDGALTNAALTVQVNSGATLQGSGSIAGTVNIGSGTVAPGDSPGTVTFGTLNFAAASTLNYELGQANAIGGALNDRILVTNDVVVDGTLNVAESAGGSFAPGFYNLITYGGTATDNGLNVGALANGLTGIVQVNPFAKQVNLIAFGGPGSLFQYWDGTDQSANGAVDAGSGTWNSSLFNWTNPAGTINATWLGFTGVFGGTAGTVSVAGAETFDGLLFETDGYSLVNGGGSLVASAAGSVLQVDGAGVVTNIAVPISGGAIAKDGTGRLNLSGANTYTLGTTIRAGVLGIDKNNGLGTGTVTMFDGTTLSSNASGTFVGNAFTLLGEGIIDTGAGDFGLTGAIGGGGGTDLRKVGSGVLFLTNAANGFGALDINQGVVNINSAGAAGVGGIAFSGAGATLQITNSFTRGGGVVLGATGGTIDTNANTLTLTGQVAGPGSLTKESSGRLILTGSTNNYTGGTFLNAGSIQIADGGSIGGGTITAAPTTTLVAGLAGNQTFALANGFVLNGPGTTTLDLVGTGTTIFTNGATTTTGTTLTLSGAISGSGALAVGSAASGFGRVIINGNNSYSGGTTIYSNGVGQQTNVVYVGSNTALGTGTVTSLGNGVTGLLNDSGSALTLANAVALSGGNDLVVGGTSNLTLTGAITGTTGNIISKAGGASLILTNASSSFGGAINVAGGKLQVDGALTNAGATVQVNSGATLAGTGTIAGAVTIANGGILAPGDSPGTLTVGSLVLNNASILNFELGQPNTAGGAFNDRVIVTGNLVLDGLLSVTDSNAFGLGVYNLFTYGTLVDNGLNISSLPAGYSGFIQNLVPGHQINLIVSAPGVSIQYWDGADQVGNGTADGGNGTWNTLNTNWTSPAFGLNTNWQSGIGVFQGTAGTVNLTQAESFFGLQFAVDGYTVAAGGGSLNTVAGSFIQTGPGVTATINAPINGAYALVKQGTGTLVLNAANTYTGGTSVSAGTLAVGNNGALGTGALALGNGTTLRLDAPTSSIGNSINIAGTGTVTADASNVTLSGVISNGASAGSLVKNGAGNLYLTNANTYSGGTTIAQGAVYAGNNLAFGTGAVALANNTQVGALGGPITLANTFNLTGAASFFTNSQVFTINGIVSDGAGAGILAKNGPGTLVLNNANTYTGGTALNVETLVVGNNAALGTGALTMAGGTTLQAGSSGLTVGNSIATLGIGTVDSTAGVFTLSGNITGAGSIQKTNTGNLILNGNNGYNGLDIVGGTVTVGTNTAGGSGNINIGNGTTLAAGGAGLVLANTISTPGSGRIDTKAFTMTLSGAISGAGTISQIGTGNLILTHAASSFGGAINVDGGKLQVDGALTNAGATVQVSSGATLAGTGTIAGAVTIANGGILAPGNSPGTLTVGSLVLNNASILNFELGQPNTAGGAFDDRVIVNSNLTLDGLLNVTDSNSFGLGVYNLFTYGEALTDNGLTISSLPSIYTGVIQTLIPGQVNLIVNAPGVSIQYWDGADLVGNGTADGGNGTWNTLNTNWTSPEFGLNTNWQGGIGVFQGTAGTVSLTQAESFVGLQFAVDGYTVAAGGGSLNTVAGSFIQTGPGVTATINAPINGADALEKQGAGLLLLNGNNGFNGLNIIAGSVGLGTNTAAGVGGISLANGTLLAGSVSGLVLTNTITTAGVGNIDSGSGVFTLNGTISGSGSINKVNVGNLILNGTNSFNGLNISGGTATLGTNTAGGIGDINIGDGTTLAAGVSGLVLANTITTSGAGRINSGSGVLTLNGAVGGGGSISQIGTGNLVLNGNNSFAGGLGINQGTLTLGTNTAAGSGAITLNAATLAAGVSGLTIANAIQTTGGGRINSGSGTFTLSGAIGNTGGFTKIGTGNLILSGTSNYNGPTIVSAGRLTVSGAVTASAITVGSGGTLAGTGSIASFAAQSGGTVSPGAPEGTIGTLTVTGNASFASGSTYLANISGTTSDRIAVGGTATLGGANLSVAGGAAAQVFGTTYTVLTATGGRSGSFTPVFSGFSQAFNPTLLYGTNDVRLRLVPASIAGLLGSGAGGSQNIANFAAAFDASVTAGFNPQAFFPIFLQSGAALGASLNQLTGEITSANSRTAIADTRLIRDAALDRLGATLGGGSTGRGDAVATTGDDEHSIAVWGTGLGSWTKSDADGNGTRLNIDAKGIVTGIDASFGPWKVGGLFNYVDSSVDTTTLGRGKVRSTGGGLYAGYRGDHGFAFGVGGAASHVRSSETRAITAPGIAQSLSSKTSGTVYQAFGEVSYDLAAAANTRVEPFFRAAYVSYHVDAINETGGFAALNIAKGKYDSTVLTAGLHGSVLLGGSAWLKGSAGYQYTGGDRSPVSLVAIAGTTSQAAIRAVPLDKSAFAGELGIDFRITPNITLGGGYNGVIGKNSQDHGVRGTLTIGF